MRLMSADHFLIADAAFAYVQQELEFDRCALASKSRKRPLVHGRALFTWIMRNHTAQPVASYPTIGELLGDRDHTTIINAAEIADKQRERDPEFQARCAAFANFLAERTTPEGAVQ